MSFRTIFIIRCGWDSKLWSSHAGLSGKCTSLPHCRGQAEIYAVTSDAPYHDRSRGRGIFKSTDGGANWTPVNKGLSVLNFSAITVDPSNPSLLYAGSSGNGIFKGIDPAPAQ